MCTTTGVSDENKICMENFHYEKDSGNCVLDAYYQVRNWFYCRGRLLC